MLDGFGPSLSLRASFMFNTAGAVRIRFHMLYDINKK